MSYSVSIFETVSLTFLIMWTFNCVRFTEEPRETIAPGNDTYSSTTSTRLPPEFDCSDKPDGRYENPSDCQSYIKCTYKVAKVVGCEDDLFYNDLLKSCTNVEELTKERKEECHIP